MPQTKASLSDPQVFQQVDKEDMAHVLAGFTDQCRKAREIGQALDLTELSKKPSQIIIQGMGGSAMGGDCLRSFLLDKCPLPIYQNRGYTLPAWVKRDALFVAVSYSGNTEETLSCLSQAQERGCKLLGITSGGKLKEVFEANGSPLILLPDGLLPRMTIGYLFFPLLNIFERLGLISGLNNDVEAVISLLEKLNQLYCPAVEEKDNPAKQTARRLHEKIPLIYACEKRFGVVALRWKAQINENAKQPAFYHVFPEMTHAELVGWHKDQKLNRQLSVVFLKDREDHPRNQERMQIVKEVISPLAGDVQEITSQGESALERIISLIYLGDYVSYYLSILNKVNPTPIAVIDYIKSRLQGGANEREYK